VKQNIRSFMKKTVLYIMASMVLLLSSCMSEPAGSTKAAYTMKITGTEGLGFTANIGRASNIKGLAGRRIKDTVPAEYAMSGDIVGGVFRKNEKEGILKVQIVKDGKILTQSETSAPRGILIVEALPQ
jgi:hypothetical protein